MECTSGADQEVMLQYNCIDAAGAGCSCSSDALQQMHDGYKGKGQARSSVEPAHHWCLLTFPTPLSVQPQPLAPARKGLWLPAGRPLAPQPTPPVFPWPGPLCAG